MILFPHHIATHVPSLCHIKYNSLVHLPVEPFRTNFTSQVIDPLNVTPNYERETQGKTTIFFLDFRFQEKNSNLGLPDL